MYDAYEGLPPWAKATLEQHRAGLCFVCVRGGGRFKEAILLFILFFSSGIKGSLFSLRVFEEGGEREGRVPFSGRFVKRIECS